MNLRVLGLLAVALVGLAAVPAVSAQDGGQTDIQIEVNENGDADWVIKNHVSLGTQSERDAFDSIISNQTKLDEMGAEAAAPFESFAGRASEEVEREMSVSVESVEGTRDGETGTVSITLSWEGFGRVDETSVRVGDVFEGGLSLDEGQSLSLRGPEGYVLSEESTLPDGDVEGNTVSIEGPTEIDESLEVIYLPEEGTDGGTQETQNETDGGTDETGTEGGNGMPGFGAVVTGVALVLVVGLRREL